ncbi:MAG: hypothetical protein COB02_09215 [Candidatus Cloacimonadota bacterium]|nr:MAG: hypothetical protein COB02_09215 [Candidatus Cloacimonadota bacterium]
MNSELELVQLQRVIEQDLNISFESNFNSHHKALCWKYNPELGYTCQAIVNASGSIVHQSNSCYDIYEQAFYLFDEPQLTNFEIQKIKQNANLEEIEPFFSGFAVAKSSSTSFRNLSYIDMDGKVLYKDKFFRINSFQNGLALVKTKDFSFNYLQTNGKLLFNETLEEAEPFVNNLAVVKKNNSPGYCIIDNTGKQVSSIYDKIYSYKEGKALVRHNHKTNFLDKNCNPILPEWVRAYPEVSSFHSDRCKMIDPRGRVNYIHESGQFLWSQNRKLIECEDFIGGFALLGDYTSDGGKKYNFAKPNGEWLSQKWFRGAESFQEGMALVQTLHRYNFLDYTGSLLLKNAVQNANSFSNGLAKVQYIDRPKYRYFINKKGENIVHESIIEAESFINGRALVTVKEKNNIREYNYLTLDGKFLFQNHFTSARRDPESFISPTIVIFNDLHNEVTRYNWFGETI